MIRRMMLAKTTMETLMLTPLPILVHLAKTHTKLARERALHRTKIFLKYYFCRRQKSPVFVISKRRSGSNLLLSYLNSVPALNFNPPEPLNPDMYYGIRDTRISKRAVLNHLAYTVNDNPSKICGFKMLFFRLKKHRLSLEDIYGRFPEAKFIILYRRSLLGQFVSQKIAEMTGKWHWAAGYRPPRSLRVDPEEFKLYCDETRQFYLGMLQYPWIRTCAQVIAYEDLTRDPQKLFDTRIFPFLGIHSVAVSTQMVKQNTKPLEELVENMDEIRPWAKEFDFEAVWPAFVSASGREASSVLEDSP